MEGELEEEVGVDCEEVEQIEEEEDGGATRAANVYMFTCSCNCYYYY